jgi:hypothetical protein
MEGEKFKALTRNNGGLDTNLSIIIGGYPILLAKNSKELANSRVIGA